MEVFLLVNEIKIIKTLLSLSLSLSIFPSFEAGTMNFSSVIRDIFLQTCIRQLFKSS